jgi:hypothetical protein
MMLSFYRFINESKEDFDIAERLADSLLDGLRSKNISKNYEIVSKIESSDGLHFDLIFKARLDPEFKAASDPHFESLPWEEMNFSRIGFASDANMKIDKQDLIIPQIEVIMVLDPRVLESPNDMRAKLIDMIAHEMTHLKQIGWNRRPFHTRPSSNSDRYAAKRGWQYFLLPEEIEAMVAGMYARSIEKGIELDRVFSEYLTPFLQSKRMNLQQYDTIMSAWIRHALENYPNSKFSKSKKISNIIDQI